MNDKIKKKLENLPMSPGVYIMYDEKGNVIYVGKAKILKNRVRQYFHNSQDYIKTIKLVENIDDLNYFITDTEVEALVLECNLIKRYRPYYNILLKDDKSYPYIMLTLDEDYPRLVFTRDRKYKQAKYFGPYVNAYFARKTIEAINRYYPMKLCSKTVREGQKIGRVCLNYHLGLCPGVCRGDIPREIYMENAKAARNILSGNYKPLVSLLSEDMEKAAEELNFEKAAELKELRSCVTGLFEKQKINVAGEDDRDILSAAFEGKFAAVQLFKVRGGKIISANTKDMIRRSEESVSDILSSFIKQYYTSAEIFIPKEIIVREGFEDISIYEKMLSEIKGSGVVIKVPQKGDKKKLADLAYKNAELHLTNKLGKALYAKEHTKNALGEISSLTGCAKEIKRIEIYDISHISGTDSVGVMTVFSEAKQVYSENRKFRIKYVSGGDDYAATSEVIFRRLERARKELEDGVQAPKFLPLPEIIFVDGGLNHISVVKKITDSFGFGITVAGLVKDANHRLRALVNSDGEEYPASKLIYASKLLNDMSEAVHKNAVSYHRKSRTKSMLKSSLSEINGVGAKRAAALINAFGSVEEISKADAEKLAKVEGINKTTAENIVEYFKEGIIET